MDSDRASVEKEDVNKEALAKEAIDALSKLSNEEQSKAFDYFQSLIKFFTNASNK